VCRKKEGEEKRRGRKEKEERKGEKEKEKNKMGIFPKLNISWEKNKR
jgi:hypothetical protein